MGLTAIVLGSAAGGGFPQWNCNCDVCRLAWAGDPRVRARTQAADQPASADHLADQLVLVDGDRVGDQGHRPAAVRTGDLLAEQGFLHTEFVSAGAAFLQMGGGHGLPYGEAVPIFHRDDRSGRFN